MNTLRIFTDGSTLNNGNKKLARSGYAVVFDDSNLNEHGKVPGPLQTNNRAEFFAFIRALHLGKKYRTNNQKLEIYSDSSLLVKTVNEWMIQWKRMDWLKKDGTPPINIDLIKEIYRLYEPDNMIINHVKAHTNKTDYHSQMNKKADQLARGAASSSHTVD